MIRRNPQNSMNKCLTMVLLMSERENYYEIKMVDLIAVSKESMMAYSIEMMEEGKEILKDLMNFPKVY